MGPHQEVGGPLPALPHPPVRGPLDGVHHGVLPGPAQLQQLRPLRRQQQAWGVSG